MRDKIQFLKILQKCFLAVCPKTALFVVFAKKHFLGVGRTTDMIMDSLKGLYIEPRYSFSSNKGIML
jgi:hypothetical protein